MARRVVDLRPGWVAAQLNATGSLWLIEDRSDEGVGGWVRGMIEAPADAPDDEVRSRGLEHLIEIDAMDVEGEE